MEIYGYKCFYSDGKNRYGKDIVIGKIYSTDKKIRYGNNGHGYHFCERLEDTFRFFTSDESGLCENICICMVRGFGEIHERLEDRVVEMDDGYYGLYACQNLEIIRVLSRKEIIDYGLNLCSKRAVRFVSLLKLNSDEIEEFKDKFRNNQSVIDAIYYYQLKDLDLYNRKYKIKH